MSIEARIRAVIRDPKYQYGSPRVFDPVEFLRGGMVLEYDDRNRFLDWAWTASYGSLEAEEN